MAMKHEQFNTNKVQMKSGYHVALNFCGSLFLRIGDFLSFAGTNFCDRKRLVFLDGN